MLDVLGGRLRAGDGPSRRSVLRVGVLGMAGATIAHPPRLPAGGAGQGPRPQEAAALPGVPPYVAVPGAPAFGQGAYLGPAGNPFVPDGDLLGDARVRSLDPPATLTLERLDDRRGLLARLDRIERRRDASGAMAGMDKF